MEKVLTIKTKIQIAKSKLHVFEAIIDPEQMKNYFIAKGSDKLEAGKTVFWSFPEFPDSFSIRVKDVKFGNYVSFCWDNDSRETLVEMKLESVNDNITMLTVTEEGMNNDDKGIRWLKDNTEGWANFLACLKAYLEYGINLRQGAYDFMKK